MKKIVLSALCITSLLSCFQQVSAVPLSNNQVAFGAALTGAGTLLAGYFSDMNKTTLGVVSGAATLLSGYIFSRYTAKSYLRSGKRLINGYDSSQPIIFNIVDINVDSAEQIAQKVVDRFSAQKNELAKSARSLEVLAYEFEQADYYLAVARRGLSRHEKKEALSYQRKIDPYLTAIKAASLIIKKNPDYQAQYAAEMEERRIIAELAKAAAARDRANAEWGRACAELAKVFGKQTIHIVLGDKTGKTS